MILGFTGTQDGMTEAQADAVLAFVHKYALLGGGLVEAHHGDCIGADRQFHHIVRNVNPGIVIIVHPPTERKKRAYCRGDRILPELPYLERDDKIAEACTHMIATPKGFEEEMRSGTWATVRRARRRNKPVTIIWPDGRVEAP